MPTRTPDVIVLGAGIVGVCAALQLQARGRDVVIVDKRGAAGEETSFGNAGLIEAGSIFPLGFPRGWKALVRYGLNRAPEANYHAAALASIAPWLLRYWRGSTPEGIARSAKALAPLVLRALGEHEALMQDAGATELLIKRGWIKLYRSPATFAKALADARRLDAFGIPYDVLDRAGVAAREAMLDVCAIEGAIHFTSPASVTDPGALVKAYAELFIKRGGVIVAGDARSLEATPAGWRVQIADGHANAAQALLALGPWSGEVFRALGYSIPLGVKRGYHMHYGLKDGAAAPSRPLLDADGGYVLAPQRAGLRLTTGAEFAPLGAKPTPVQVDRTEPFVRALVPGLGARLDAEPWMGARPCLPDMLPVIGPAPRHKGLWFDFGHQHLGFTLGPVTGLLVAAMMTGGETFTDPTPYRAARFD